MKYENFKEILKNNKLTIKKFSELANISYNTCNAWSKRGKVSNWVAPFLNLYIENQQLQEKNNNSSDKEHQKEYQELLQLKESLQNVMNGINK